MGRLIAGSCFILLVSGCAQTGGGWEHADRPQEAWAQDEAECRAQASQKIGRELRVLDETWSDPNDTALGVVNAWEWQDTNRRKRSFVDDCMARKGYVWAIPEESAEGEPEAQ